MHVGWLWLALLAPSAGAPVALAEQFIGVEPGTDEETPSAGEAGSDEVPPDRAKPAPKPKVHRQAVAPPDEEEPSPDLKPQGPAPAAAGEPSPWYFFGGLGLGSDEVGAQVTVGYAYSKWLGVETTYYYDRFQGDSESGQQQGPEFDLVLRGANPTLVTPYVGVGPGYYRWARQLNGETFDDSGSVTGHAFGGLEVRLTKNFAVILERREIWYLGTPPRSFSDVTIREPRSAIVTNIGFRAIF
jgi:hypothetical protein